MTLARCNGLPGGAIAPGLCCAARAARKPPGQQKEVYPKGEQFPNHHLTWPCLLYNSVGLTRNVTLFREHTHDLR